MEGVRKLWHDHMRDGKQASLLCKLLTLELACRINLDGLAITWDEC